MTERELAQALQAGLTGVAIFRWGWVALESASVPATLPMVTLQRLNADVAGGVDDMCRGDAADLVGNVTLETHAWAAGYEEARLLQDEVRPILHDGGWNLQSEQDSYDGLVRCWRIAAQWSNIGPLSAS